MDDRVEFTDVYVDDAIVERATDVLRSTRYVKGPVVETFETAFADVCDVEHAVAVNSGTAAILLALRAVGVGAGDDVFVPAHTFFATVSPVLALDANPVFVDVDPERYTLDPAALADRVEAAANPTAVLPVHLYGQPAAMGAIDRVATEHDLTVVEDACQAHGATSEGRPVGGLGRVGCFSFYPSKNVTVGGDGGMLVTDEAAVARAARRLRNHGRDETGRHVSLGLNYRLGDLKAAIGHEQLGHLPEWNRERRRVAAAYTERLADCEPVVTPTEYPDADHVYHLYVVRVPPAHRDPLRAFLADRGVETGVHYDPPVYRHEAVADRVGPVAERETAAAVTERVVSLPVHPRLTTADVERVVEGIREYFASVD